MIYVVLAALLGVVASLVFVTRWGMRAKDEATRAADLYREQERRSDSMQFERDEYKRRLDVTTQQLAVSKVRLATAETQRNAAFEAARARLVDLIKDSTPAAALDVLNGLLSTPLVGEQSAKSTRPSSEPDRKT